MAVHVSRELRRDGISIMGILKIFAIIGLSLLVIVALGIAYVQYRIADAKGRATAFCEKFKTGADINSVIDFLEHADFDQIVIYNEAGNPSAAIKKLSDWHLKLVGLKTGTMNVMFLSGTPALSTCNVGIQSHTVDSKNLVQHE